MWFAKQVLTLFATRNIRAVSDVSAMRKVAPWNNLYDALNELAKAARLSNFSDKGDSKETPSSDNK